MSDAKLQLLADDLAADGLGQGLPELHDSGVLVGCSAALDVVLDLLLQRRSGEPKTS